jgi:transposase InsO family protein
MFFARDWLSTTIDEFIATLDAYIRWYNETRIKISLGGLSPAAHRRSLGIPV